jgi:dephospho-CoA kinase
LLKLITLDVCDKTKMLKIGITGGIGCGKSEVCRQLEENNIPIIHADLVAREMLDDHEGIKSQVKKMFGDDIYVLSGKLDRKRMADIIFNNDRAKQLLNSIVHPHVITCQEAELKKLEDSQKYKIAGVEAALIYEAGAEKQFDLMIVVAASEDIVVERLMKRDGLTRAEIFKRINSQMSLMDKIKRADFVIYNDGSFDELNHKVKRLLIWLNNQER